MTDRPPRSRVSRRVRLVAAAVLAGAALAGGVRWQWGRERSSARSLMQRGQYAQARSKLVRLLWLRPDDFELHLLMAEACARDDSGAVQSQALQAVAHLQQIPDSAPQGHDARIREARLTLLVLHRPLAAQSLLNRALAINPQSTEAHALHWTLLSLTGREDLARPVFLRLYELGPDRARINYLVNWYFSQIDLPRFTAGLDESMGFRQSPDETARRAELNRLLAYRQAEPEQPVVHAALARWFQEESDPEQAWHVLDEGQQAADALSDPFFVSMMVSVLIELGRLELADELFSRWPGPRDDFAYWKAAGLLDAELRRDYAAASAAFARALELWPGPSEWRIRFRLASCLALSGNEPQAAAVRQRATAIQELFNPDHQQLLRDALESPGDSEHLRSIVDFYQALDCQLEVRLWKEVIEG